jgi:hypothetical protein
MTAKKESVDAARDGTNPSSPLHPTSSDVERMRDALQKILAIAPPSIDASWGSVVEIAEAALLSLSRGREGEHQSAGRDQIVMDWMQARADWDTDVGEACRTILAVFIRSLKQEGGER